MKRAVRQWLSGVVAAGCLVAATAGAQPAASRTSPPLPQATSPVALFRKLIAATPAEAETLLQDRTPEQRRIIQAKIEEYRILPPPVREWRLKATELRWYLQPLMERAPGERGSLLLTVPEADRPLVAARLQQWDLLPRSEQEALLNNELALRYVARPGHAPTPTTEQMARLPAQERARLETAVAQWQAMPSDRRDELSQRFTQFFSLTQAEQGRTLELLTASERDQLRVTIDTFAVLPPDERARCLRALREFSQFSQEERVAFLSGAERWKRLSEAQRASWRALVNKLPPLPPGLDRPPLPPGAKLSPGARLDSGAAVRTLATNSL